MGPQTDGFQCTVGPHRICHEPCARVDEQSQHTYSKKQSHKKHRCTAKSLATCWKQWLREKPPIARCNLLGDCATRPLWSSWHRGKTFLTTGFREPIDRADEAAEAEADEEIPSPAQQRWLLRLHVNLGDPTFGGFFLRNGRCRPGIVRWTKRHFHFPECDTRPLPRTRPAAALLKSNRFNQVFGINTMEVKNLLDRENHNENCTSFVTGHISTREHAGRTCQPQKPLPHHDSSGSNFHDAKEVLITDQGTEFRADFLQMCHFTGILYVVTDSEAPLASHCRGGAWSTPQDFEKACSLEAPTAEAEVDQRIDLTFAELNRRVGRQLRLPSSLHEDDIIDPYTIAQDARDVAERGRADGSCTRMRRRRRSPSGVHSSPLSTSKTAAGIGGRRTRLHLQTEGRSPRMVRTWRVRLGWRTKTWTERNRLGAGAELLATNTCNRTQAMPATNEEAEGIEAVASLSPELADAVREGRTRHFADITAEGDPHDDEEIVVEGDVTDVLATTRLAART